MVAPDVRRIGIAELEQRLGRDRTTIARWIKTGAFPAPAWIGTRRCWILADVERWIAAQAKPAKFNLPVAP